MRTYMNKTDHWLTKTIKDKELRFSRTSPQADLFEKKSQNMMINNLVLTENYFYQYATVSIPLRLRQIVQPRHRFHQ